MRLAEIVKLPDKSLLRISALDLDQATPAEITRVVDFLSKQVSRLSDKDICYGFYCSLGVPKEVYGNQKARWANKLRGPLSAEYRKRMLGWFEYALVKRANAGGGGPGIKAVEGALGAFLEHIPQLLALGPNRQFDLRSYLADLEQSLNRSRNRDSANQNKYLDTSALTAVGRKIMSVIDKDAEAAGLFRGTRAAATIRMGAKMSFQVVWDTKDKVWIIPPTPKTRPHKSTLAQYGFRWSGAPKYRWEIQQITPLIQRDFDMPQDAKGLFEDWFWTTWYPKNSQRFTRVFSDYARNLQSSYSLVFPKSRKGKVKFKRNIRTPNDAIEELRFRYIGRQGREPWLLVMDLFLQLRSTSGTGKNLEHLIDRMNGLQHSNGLFLEQFPSSVVRWYREFLNAKYHSPSADILAKYIPDRDLKELFMYLARMPGRPKAVSPDQWEQLPEHYHEMGKDESENKGPNWRERGYPYAPGKEQPDRFSEEVQRGLGQTFLSDLWKERATKGR